MSREIGCACGCQGHATAATLREELRTRATARRRRHAGGLRVDLPALRRVLGGRDELVEALEVQEATAKATGRPGANAPVMWRYFTTAVYTSGDLPVLAVREMLQNSVDAVKAAIRARKTRAGEGRIAVGWDRRRRALTVQDNGIGMDAQTILDKFLSLGESGKAEAGSSEEAAGGFGVAKAVILGTSPTFRWELHTRDNLAVSEGAGQDVRIYDAEPLAGTRITLFDIAEDFDRTWDYARQEYVSLEDRLRELLAANDLPGMTLLLDGEVVRPMFSRRGGSKVAIEGSWGRGTGATIKAFRRPPGDRQGAYYVRLGGLFQFKEAARRGNLKADVVVDLATTVRPGQHGYPLNAARDGLQDRARWAFNDLVEEVERENESVGRSMEDEVYDPDSDDERERRGAAELADLAAEAFADEAFQKALAEAAGGIADFYAERAKDPGIEAPVASLAPAGTRARPAEDQPTRGVVLPPGVRVATLTPVEADIAAPGDPSGPVRQLRAVLEAADEVVTTGGGVHVLGPAERDVLQRAEAGEALDEQDVRVLQGAIERAADSALDPSGGGLVQAATVDRVATSALGGLRVDDGGARRRKTRRNPFGRLAGLRISKKNYDRKRAYRFKKGFQRWMPHLTAWDATLRLVATEARIRRRFKPGFVLDDELLGLTTSTSAGSTVIYIHPDRLHQVVKAHRERPLAIAAYLHGVACHELTHADGRMGKGHSEEFVAAREDLGHATGHLLPAIAVLVQNVLGLPVKATDDQKRIARLEAQLARARSKARDKRSTAIDRLEGELAEARAQLDAALAESARISSSCDGACGTCRRADPAERVLDVAASVLAASPPAGLEPHDVADFLERHRPHLKSLVQAALRGRALGGSP